MKNNTIELLEPIDMVKIAASRVVPGDVDPEELANLVQRRHSMQHTQRRLLPMEELSSHGVVEVVRDLEQEVAKLERHRRIVEFSKGEYQIQLLEPLKWRRADTRLPVLGVFNIDLPNFGFVGTAGSGREQLQQFVEFGSRASVRIVPPLPKPVIDCYRDIIEQVRERAQTRYTSTPRAQGVEVSLVAKFNGLVPDYVKDEMVRAAKSKLFTRFYVIAEIVEWAWDTIVTSRKGDPILVGFDGHEFWRIAVFDTTSAEQLMADEYSVKAE